MRALRLDRGLSIAQVAESTGLTKGFLSQLERNLTSVSLSALARICSALGVRFGDVLDEHGRGDPPRVGDPLDRGRQPRGRRPQPAGGAAALNLIESRIPPG